VVRGGCGTVLMEYIPCLLITKSRLLDPTPEIHFIVRNGNGTEFMLDCA